METQTPFDLNAAIATWRQELAAQTELAPEARRELDTHLRDTIAELQRRGLNDEESFWLARRRIGQPRELCEEFVKADPVKVWRKRILWIAVGILGLRLWSGVVTYAWYAISEQLQIYLLQHNPMLPGWVLFYLPFLRIHLAPFVRSPILTIFVCYAPILCLTILFARGRLRWAVAGLRLLFKSRHQFLFVAAGGLAIYIAWAILDLLSYSQKGASIQGNPSVAYVVQAAFAAVVWPGALIALIAWLLPTKEQSPLKQE